ncbi:MAG: hypothetical protein KDA86_23560 [Planctomycetaceae bacterium]|nr:hypothetical protein [Planctomycetaceae bacterium]
MTRVDILSIEAASGHKSAAEALRYALEARQPTWNVRVIDLGDVLQHQSRLLRLAFGFGMGFFNWCMRRERYFFFVTSVRFWILVTLLVTRLQACTFLLRRTSRFWSDGAPDVVISVTPMMHTIVYEAARCLNPKVHCITIPVDYCEMVPGYWYQPAIDQHYLLGSQQLVDDAIAGGVPESEWQRLSGMVIDVRFYGAEPIERGEFLRSLGLDPALPTGVISFGGQGTVNVLRCARAIGDAKIPTNLICLCGRNEGLLKTLQSLDSPFPIAALRFDPEPPVTILRTADYLIGKPGVMTLTEALITDTPLIFIESQGLSTVQGANEQWVLEQETGVMADSPESVPGSVRQVLEDDQIHARIQDAQHRGVFDALAAIEAIVSENTLRQDVPRPLGLLPRPPKTLAE